MSISSYEENGIVYWKVYVNLRSKEDQSIRIQKVKLRIESRERALAEEKKWVKWVASELAKREGYGKSWYDIIGQWEFENRESGYAARQMTTVLDLVSLLHRYTEAWLRRPASQIHKADAKELFNDLQAQGKTKHLQRTVKQAINLVYTWAIEERLIKEVFTSPVHGIQIQKDKSEKRPEILTIVQIRQLLSASRQLNDPWYPVWALALLTEMRNGELYALLWSDVDFKDKRITVSKSFNGRTGKIKSTKAGYWRNIPISEELNHLLQDLRSKAGARKEVPPRLPGWIKGNQAAQLRMFCVGIGLPSVKFHTLRACFSTQLLSNDVAPATVMKICGWRDLKTMQRYIRLAGIDERGATESLKVLPDIPILMGSAQERIETACEEEKHHDSNRLEFNSPS